jgi:hypothetical protein
VWAETLQWADPYPRSPTNHVQDYETEKVAKVQQNGCKAIDNDDDDDDDDNHNKS